MPWIVHGAAGCPRSAPWSRVTVPGPRHSDRRTGPLCQMAALYTRSGTVSEIVYERLSALQISLMHLEDGARPVLAAAMVMGLN